MSHFTAERYKIGYDVWLFPVLYLTNGTTIHLLAQNKNIGVIMDSLVSLSPSIQEQIL